MNWDLKSYLKYRKETFDFKLFRKPIFWAFVVLIVLDFILWKTTLAVWKKLVLTIIAILVAWFFYEWNIFQTGEHRHYIREQLQIPSRADIKKMKMKNTPEPAQPTPDLTKIESEANGAGIN